MKIGVKSTLWNKKYIRNYFGEPKKDVYTEKRYKQISHPNQLVIPVIKTKKKETPNRITKKKKKSEARTTKHYYTY